jgi:hypothetical protein
LPYDEKYVNDLLIITQSDLSVCQLETLSTGNPY